MDDITQYKNSLERLNKKLKEVKEELWAEQQLLLEKTSNFELRKNPSSPEYLKGGTPVHSYYLIANPEISPALLSHIPVTIQTVNKVKQLIEQVFGNNPYVLITGFEKNKTSVDQSTMALAKQLHTDQKGKITFNDYHRMSPVFELDQIQELSPRQIQTGIKRSFLNVLNYQGYPFANSNVLLLNISLDKSQEIVSLFDAIKPLAIINLVFSDPTAAWMDIL